MDSVGSGIVDQSDILSIQVTQFALLMNPTLSRADLTTIVGDLSSLTFGFQLPLPVDPDCRIRIVFPADQPLTLDLTTSTGTNLFDPKTPKPLPNEWKRLMKLYSEEKQII